MTDYMEWIFQQNTSNIMSDEEYKERSILLQLLVNKARLGIVILNQEHKVVDANERFAEMLGYTLEEVKELHIWDWEVVQSSDEIREKYSDLSVIGGFLETRHRRKDGSIFDVELNSAGTSITGKNGKYNMSMCICQDISARVLLEKQLHHSENKFRSFVEKSADIILTLDPELDITYISPNCNGSLGYEAEELIGKKMLSILLPEDRRIFKSAIQAGFEGSPDPQADYRIIQKNTQVEWYSMRFSVSEDDKGCPMMNMQCEKYNPK